MCVDRRGGARRAVSRCRAKLLGGRAAVRGGGAPNGWRRPAHGCWKARACVFGRQRRPQRCAVACRRAAGAPARVGPGAVRVWPVCAVVCSGPYVAHRPPRALGPLLLVRAALWYSDEGVGTLRRAILCSVERFLALRFAGAKVTYFFGQSEVDERCARLLLRVLPSRPERHQATRRTKFHQL